MKLKQQDIPTLLLITSSILCGKFGYDYGSRNHHPDAVIGVILIFNAVMFYVWDVLRLRANKEKIDHKHVIRVEIVFAFNILALAYIMTQYRIAFMSWGGYVVLQSINVGLAIFITLQLIQYVFPKKK